MGQPDRVDVVAGLGWPGSNREPVGPTLGWPRYPQNPQVGPQPDEKAQRLQVSRETLPSADRSVSRETGSPDPSTLDPSTLDPPTPDPPAASVVIEESPVVPAPPVPSSSGASRFGPHPAPGTPYRTAADVATEPVIRDDDSSTPLARSVEQGLRIREGRLPGLARPARTRVMVVANQKGGVGKTTTTVNMAAALAQHGLRVLVVDLDPQGNASTALAIDHHRGTPSTYDAVVEGVPLIDVVQQSPEVPGLYVVPATIDLAGAEIELVSLVARESRLRKALHAHPQVFGEGDDRIDYVLIDCPPSLGLLTLNALVAGDEMLIPIQAEYYALEGLGQLIETVDMVRAHLNPDLTVSTILLTMYDARTRLSAGVAEEVRAHFGGQVLRTAIPRSVRISEAPSYGQTVMTYDPGSPGALSYLEAAREMAQRAATTSGDAR
jgi:chromosome partitioning protein